MITTRALRRIVVPFSLLVVLAACGPSLDTPKPTMATLPNPASAYCVDQGGRLEIRTAADGSQAGYCIFPDGSECEEWAYFRGECAPGGKTPAPGLPNPASAYCVDQGGRLEIRTAADGSQAGYCIFPDGSECEEWAYFRGECAPGGTAAPAAFVAPAAAYERRATYTNAELSGTLARPGRKSPGAVGGQSGIAHIALDCPRQTCYTTGSNRSTSAKGEQR